MGRASRSIQVRYSTPHFRMARKPPILTAHCRMGRRRAVGRILVTRMRSALVSDSCKSMAVMQLWQRWRWAPFCYSWCSEITLYRVGSMTYMSEAFGDGRSFCRWIPVEIHFRTWKYFKAMTAHLGSSLLTCSLHPIYSNTSHADLTSG